jgi:hypothetical protein
MGGGRAEIARVMRPEPLLDSYPETDDMITQWVI